MPGRQGAVPPALMMLAARLAQAQQGRAPGR
jgi:hypothetical protein